MPTDWKEPLDARDWEACEQIVKRSPSQAFADALVKTEADLDTKSDHRAVRKLLFLLGQKGFTASAETPPEKPDSEAGPAYVGALMANPDAAGETLFVICKVHGTKSTWLSATAHETAGVRFAKAESGPAASAKARLLALEANIGRGRIACRVEPEYALWRVKRAIGAPGGRHTPPGLATWRGEIDATEQRPHPAEGLKPKADASADERRAVAVAFGLTQPWRLEMGVAAPAMRALVERIGAIPETDEEKRKAVSDEVLASQRESAFTPEVVADHASRLLDLAAVVSVHDLNAAGIILAARENLLSNKGESDYAKGLMDKTMFLLTASIRQSQQRAESARP